MIILAPSEYYDGAVKRAKQMLLDESTVIVAVGEYGVVLRNSDAEVAVTRDFVDIQFLH